jgi:hypothetical protein
MIFIYKIKKIFTKDYQLISLLLNLCKKKTKFKLLLFFNYYSPLITGNYIPSKEKSLSKFVCDLYPHNNNAVVIIEFITI